MAASIFYTLQILELYMTNVRQALGQQEAFSTMVPTPSRQITPLP